ncbi:hypothetical protein A2422_04575 [Candidatus Woesebacteria bacterium RIFOXYC1_FULL_31_51]|nr:MAG: hypothetical protein A2185_04185 [Candidatus Woesebacteria bacterium RIFOXYA1_FULL_31_71]OGM77921.1 MAG: hypothetical protein A2375_03395 [Candidatus Woesebacteria bacterium RIFOXYB1_FULL_31_120]OGM82151.1 MAG: hypothetical protein A2422_04575 [Candidatus Woesebacteria bacterium RIFOXYC1_FULL_31_51]OGM86191.1 MAG: hypothetical protein A2595_01515 [Candidatus Woesebacteria bacterium RIFOXYD1_FULL_31_53]HBP39928.1 hypothetical protein [Candidatus Woesebacteria bacterium]
MIGLIDMEDNSLKLGIYSKENLLSEKLKNIFKEKYIDAIIFNDLKRNDLKNFGYLIINLLDDFDSIENIKGLIDNLNCRIIVLYPLDDKNEQKLLDLNLNLGVILIPKEVDFSNTVNLEKVSQRIVKETLSFGISGQTLSLKNFINLNKSLPEQKEIKIKNNNAILLPVNTSTKSNTITNKKKSYFSNKKFYKKLTLLFITILLVFLIPLVLIFLSLSTSLLSLKLVTKNSELSSKLIKASTFFSYSSKSLSFGIPIFYNTSNLLIKTTNLGEESLSLLILTKDFVSKIMGDEIYDFEFYSNGISASLDKIHTDIGFLQSDINEQEGFIGNYIRNKLLKENIDIGVLKNKIYEFKNLTSRISNLLGLDKPKKYLILFQNNMELRPTGGFIGSFAIITFDKGRLTEIVVNDVYSADGQLKGHVDPPGPILKYLGEGGWFLRDSNWDPDFKTSSQKVEWFLDKETDQQVDGVVAIDLYFIQSLLKITGPINLVDFKKTIDDKNLYQTTQSEVESEFFPGSIKKASFLTSLSKNLIIELENLPSSKYFLLFKEIYKSLEERHIQVFLHDQNSQEAISSLGFSGQIDTNTSCGSRCFSDNYSLIDANLGVNKANLFIKRSQDIKLQINKEYINHELSINYENNAGKLIGAPGNYKSYTRLLIPQEASVVSLRIFDSNNNYKDLEFDTTEINNRKEIGFLFELLPSTSSKIQIVWILPNNKLNQGGEFRLLVRKQAGTENDGLRVNISSKDLTLTGKALPVYNTTLAKDFSARLFFK